jgi:hypothetical protein
MLTKSLTAVSLAAVASLVLTGCIKETGEFTVSKKQTVTGSIAMQVDNSMWDFMQLVDTDIPGAARMTRRQYIKAFYTSEELLPSLPAGVSMKPVSGKKFSGMKVVFTKASFRTVNKVGRELAESDGASSSPMFRISLNKKKQVSFRYVVQPLGLDDTEGLEELEGTEDLFTENITPTYKVSVTMPGKVLKTNGTKKRRTITWKGAYPETKRALLTATSKRRRAHEDHRPRWHRRSRHPRRAVRARPRSRGHGSRSDAGQGPLPRHRRGRPGRRP